MVSLTLFQGPLLSCFSVSVFLLLSEKEKSFLAVEKSKKKEGRGTIELDTHINCRGRRERSVVCLVLA